jgi:hypothetical protein
MRRYDCGIDAAVSEWKFELKNYGSVRVAYVPALPILYYEIAVEKEHCQFDELAGQFRAFGE